MLNGLNVLRSVSIHDMTFDKDKWTVQLTPLLTLFSQVSKDISASLPKGDLEDTADSMLSFIQQEIFSAQSTLQALSTTFSGLQSVLHGKGLLTPDIFRQGTSVIKGEVPKEWLFFWEGPEQPMKWLLAFSQKACSLAGWLSKTKSQSLLSQPVNLQHIFHSEIFLNCLRQMTARKLQVSMDNLEMQASFDKSSLKSEMSLCIQGLYLQGSGCKAGVITDSEEGQSEYIQVQEIYLAWTVVSQLQIQSSQEKGVFPIFHSGSRENILCKVSLPVHGLPKRVLAGTALFITNEE